MSHRSDPEGALYSPPVYPHSQRFQLPQHVPWGAGWKHDPVRGGVLYAGPRDLYLRLKKNEGSPPRLEGVTWYQLLAGGSLANVTPAGTFEPTGATVQVRDGYLGYSIEQQVPVL
jgi:hypothetical protein